MKKFLFLLIPIFISCGTPEAEIQEEIDVTFSENSSTTTLQQPEEGSELKLQLLHLPPQLLLLLLLQFLFLKIPW